MLPLPPPFPRRARPVRDVTISVGSRRKREVCAMPPAGDARQVQGRRDDGREGGDGRLVRQGDMADHRQLLKETNFSIDQIFACVELASVVLPQAR